MSHPEINSPRPLPPVDEKKNEARNLILNLSRHAGPLLSNESAMAKIRRFAPDRLEGFWRSWDALDNRLLEYLEGRLPWSETREVPGEVSLPGAQMRDQATGELEPLRCHTIEYVDGPDVMSGARTVFLLIFELIQEFTNEDGPHE